VKAKKGTSQIVVDFNGVVAGGAGLPLSAFQLTTLPKGKKAHVKTFGLKSVVYNPSTHTITITPKGKLNLNQPLKLTISGLSGGPSSLILSKHGASVAVIGAGQSAVSIAPVLTAARPAAVSAAAVDALFIGSLDDLGLPTPRRHHGA
jgi:hypothetical protein